MNTEVVKNNLNGKIRDHLQSFGYEYGEDQIRHVEEGLTPHIIGVPEVPESGYHKCTACFLILKSEHLEDGKCPVCHLSESLEKMCPNDKPGCNHEKTEKISYCPTCGKPMCPQCGCHDVVALSRITGYYGEINGWNQGKQAEHMDRHRVNIE